MRAQSVRVALAVIVFVACAFSAAADPEPLENWRTAVAETRRLAERDTVSAYERALQLHVNRPPTANRGDEARALNVLARVELYLALTADSVQHARKAAEVAHASGDRESEAEAELTLSVNLVNQGDVEGLVAAATHALALLEGADRADLVGEALLRNSMAYRRVGDADASMTMCLNALDLAQRSNDSMALAYACQGMAAAYSDTDRSDDARRQYERMRDHARAARSTMLEAEAELGAAGAAFHLGDVTAADLCLNEASELARAAGAPFLVNRALFAKAQQLRLRNEPAKALPVLADVLARYERYPNPIGLWYTLNERSLVLEGLGEAEAAERDADRAYALTSQIGDGAFIADSASRLAEIARRRGDFRRADEMSALALESMKKSARERIGRRTVELARRYEADSKQKQIDRLALRSRQQDIALQQQIVARREQWTALGGVSLALAVTVVLFWRGRRANQALSRKRDELETTRKALRAANLFQSAVIDGTNFGIIATAPDGLVTVFNAGAEAMLEYPRDEVVGKMYGSRFADPAEIDSAVERLSSRHRRTVAPAEVVTLSLLDRERLERETFLVRRDGGRIPVRLRLSAIRGSDGEYQGALALVQDLTEAKATAAALESSRSTLAKVFDAAPDGFLLFDQAGALTECNSGVERIFGLLRGQIVDPTLRPPGWMLIAENGREFPTIESVARDVFRTGTARRGQIASVRHADGRRTWLSLNVEPLRDADATVCGAVASVTDITAIKSAESALRAEVESRAKLSEENFRVLAGRMPCLVALLSPTCRLMYSNGYCVDGALSRGPAAGLSGSMQCAHPDDWSAVAVASDKALANGEPHTFETRIQCEQGSAWRWHRFHFTPQKDGEGKILCWVVTGLDIHVHKESATLLERAVAERTAEFQASEARFRLAFEHAGIGMLILDLEGKVVRFNRVIQEMLGFSAELLRGFTYENYTHADDIPRHREAIESLRNGERAYCRVEQRCVCADQHTLWGLLTISMVRDAEGRPVQFVCQLEDITVRRRADEDLRLAHAQAIEASRLKSEFLATMSHEIRTPMNGIVGTVEMLSASPLSARQREMSRVIEQSATALLRIIDDLLDLSRIEAGKLRVETADFNPRTVIEDTVALFVPVAEPKGLALTVHVAPGLDTTVRGDPIRFRQVLTNLLSNAVKFTVSGGVTIAARMEPTSPADVVAMHVEVRDTGIGIPASLEGRLFKPFVQASSSVRRNHSGAGLGLAISRHLVELMGGQIGYATQEGRGSTFWYKLALPRRASDASAELPPVAVAAPQSRSLRLLVVEDNEAGRFVARLQLENLGHLVDVAEDGSVALESMAQNPYDAVLMDCQMPRLDGYQACSRIRSGAVPGIDPKIPVIALTAFAMPGDRERGLAVGMNDYITKPLTVESLRHALIRCGLMPADAPKPVPQPAVTDEAPFDQAQLARLAKVRAPDGRPLSEVYVAMFREEVPVALGTMDQLFDARNGQELARAAHSLAGNSANLGAQPMRRALREIVVAARVDDWLAVESARASVRVAWERLRAALPTFK